LEADEMNEKRKGKVGIYCRVSTTGQSTHMQEVELRQYAQRRGWQVYRVYADNGVSGTERNRPALAELFADCRRGVLSGVLVWRFDRFARSLRQLVTALDEFRKLGINFVSATEGIDTTVPSGELLFGIIGSIAQFERSLISDRVRSGLAEARRKGRRLGRPPLRKIDALEIQQLRRERKSGASFKKLAADHGISVWSAFHLSKRAKA
jgi:DNA invertase Pin-like site-specific DNA recombinase